MLRYTWLRMFAVLTVLALFVAACGEGATDVDDPADDAGDDTADDAGDDLSDDMGDDADDADDMADDADDDMSDDDDSADETDDDADDADADDDEMADGTDPDDVEVGDIAEDQLVLGNVLPETGDLAFLGDPMITATELAVEEINEAGGVLGNDVQLLPGDSGDGDGTVANQTVDRHLAEGVNAIIGAAASGISLTIIDKITGNGIIQFSPANTAPTFTDYPDNGLFFRTAPTDALQGPVLAEQIIEDGGTAVAILGRSDDYGRGLVDAASEALTAAGADVVYEEIYDQQAQNFDAEVSAAAAQSPDAVVIIGFDETARILSSMIEQGIGPDAVNVYGADGNASNDLAEQTDPGNPAVLEGMRGTRPAATANETFVTNLQEFNPDLTELSFAAESYDAVNIIALAAEVAGSTAPEAIAAEINEITRTGGTECQTFAECFELIESGEEFSYTGALGALNFTDDGEPGSGTYEVWEYDAEGQLQVLRTAEVEV